MKLQFVSDLHLEFPENRAYLAEHPLEVTGDILFVAGDSAYLDLPDSKEDTYSRYVFWDWASEHYQRVIVCFGNHDFYDMKKTTLIIRGQSVPQGGGHHGWRHPTGPVVIWNMQGEAIARLGEEQGSTDDLSIEKELIA